MLKGNYSANRQAHLARQLRKRSPALLACFLQPVSEQASSPAYHKHIMHHDKLTSY